MPPVSVCGRPPPSGSAVDSRLVLDTVRVVYRGLGETAAPAIMVTVPATMAVTEVVELIMVLSQGLYDRFKREREEARKEAREESRQAVAANQARWETWNQLRLEAEARGEASDVGRPGLTPPVST